MRLDKIKINHELWSLSLNPDFPLISCATLDKFLNLSEFHLWNGCCEDDMNKDHNIYSFLPWSKFSHNSMGRQELTQQSGSVVLLTRMAPGWPCHQTKAQEWITGPETVVQEDGLRRTLAFLLWVWASGTCAAQNAYVVTPQEKAEVLSLWGASFLGWLRFTHDVTTCWRN